MSYCLKGTIAEIDKDSVVIDVRDVGYHVLVSHPDQFALGESTIIYTYNVVKEDDEYLVGFKSKEDRDVFLSLIKVKGLGPKSALNAMSGASSSDIIAAIASNNVAFLKKLPGLGSKAAGQIILDLKGELTGTKGNPKQYEEVYEALKELGFKGAAIDRVLATINEPNASTEDLLRIALGTYKR